MKSIKQHISLKNELQSLRDCILERLIISKTKETNAIKLTWNSFIEALLKHNDGTLELEKDNIEIFVSPPDKFANYTLLGRLKGRQITEMRVYGNRNDGYRISIDIDDDFQSGLTILDMGDLIDVFGEEQLTEIYNYLFYEANK